MNRNTIGGFLAALRKAKGMTQQEVADRLNVSNKTISKWERDEGYPELTAIPALAELFEVTSDEILRGERISQLDRESEQHKAKVEKQLRSVINNSIAKFINFSYLALALTMVGLICLFTIAYAFYRPVLGFGIMLLFVIASITTELVLINLSRASTRDHEIPVDQDALVKHNKTTNRYAFAVFMVNMAVVILSLPLIFVRDPNVVESVINMKSYYALMPFLLLIILLIIVFSINLFGELLLLNGKSSSKKAYPAKRLRRMNFAQIAAFAASLISPLCAIFFDIDKLSLNYLAIAFVFAMYGLFIICMIVPVVKSANSTERYMLFAAGLRNVLYAIALIYALSGITVSIPANGGREIGYTFKPGAFWIFLDATAAYLLARYFILRQKCPGPGR